MICGPAYAYSDGTVVRYNISENDGSMHGKRTIFEIGGGGGVDHSYIYNNTIYTSEDHSVFSVMRGEPWDGKPKGTNFINNIFAINGTVAQFALPAIRAIRARKASLHTTTTCTPAPCLKAR